MPVSSPNTLRVLIVSQYGFPPRCRNMNAYQRVLHTSDWCEVHLLIRSREDISDELLAKVHLHRAPVHNRWLFLAYSVFLALYLRMRGCSFLFTDPSGFAAVGFVAQLLFGYTWVLDVWDRPRWRTGEHEAHSRPPISDRLVFALMRRARVYLLSVLPQAAKDIPPDPQRSLQLYNAIDLSTVAATPLTRGAAEDPTLHLAYGRSQFWETMGLDVVMEAAAVLVAAKVPFKVHLVGQVSEADRQRILHSPVAENFVVHGFIAKSRIEFFRSIHAGLVPYMDFEDLRYIFPIKVLEHLSQGNPVIASDLPGLTSMVQHEVNGLLVKPGCAKSLAAAIHRLQQDTSLFNSLSRGALSSIHKYDVKAKHREIFHHLARLASSRA